jgi:hypothetical protein
MTNPEDHDLESISYADMRRMSVDPQTGDLNWRGAHRGKHVISTPWAIIIAGALIAAAIALTNHWSFDPGPQGGTATLLNRWTGRVVACGGHVLPGWEIPCPIPAEIPK